MGHVSGAMPVAMGATMGVMMPFMVHGLGGAALVWFVLAHVGVIAVVAGLGILALRWFGRVPRWLRGHRPSWRHVGQMLVGAALGFVVLHFTAHGFGGV